MTMLWGIDSASRLTGITAGAGDVMPAVGVWDYDDCGDNVGALMEALWRDLDALAARLGIPTAVIFESPILTGNDYAKGGLLKLRKLYGMTAVIELWCALRKITCEEASSKALKKRLTGDFLAKKPAMVAMCRRLKVPLPPGKGAEDAADSFSAWLVGLEHHGDRALLTKWDQLLYSRRGQLT